MMTFQRFTLRHVVVSLAVAAAILMLGIYDVSAQKPGTKKWTFTSKANFCSPVALGPNGTVYVGTFKQGDRGPLIALNANGKMKWGLPSKGAGLVLEAPVVGADGTVYVVPNNGILYAVRPTGSIKWKLPIRGSGKEGTLALGHDGTIYVPVRTKGDNYLVAVGPDGTKKWSLETGSGGSSSPLVGPDGTIYVGGIRAIKADGTLKAKFRGSLRGGMAIDRDGTLYLNMDREFGAMQSDGTKAWSFKSLYRIVPVIGPNGVIYAANSRGALYAFGRDGTKLWETSGNWGAGRYGDEAYPAVGSDGTIYVATERGKLYAFSSKGVKKWEADTGASRSRNPWPVIGPDGTVYVGTGYGKHGRGMVVAFHTGCRGPAASPWPMARQNAQNTARAPAARNARAIPKPDLSKKRQNAPNTARTPTVLDELALPLGYFLKKDAYSVDHVVDGDTFVVAVTATGRQGKTFTSKVTVRLMGVDAPQAVERYGKEASAFLTKLLKGKKVYLFEEAVRKDKEEGQFMSAYRAPDGLFINAEVIRRGYGRVRAHKPYSFKLVKVFQQLERIARNSKKGLWASIARVPTAPSAPAIPKPALPNKDAYSVDHVVDGDTFVVTTRQTKTGISKMTVRLIGVDAPQGVEQYGKEASAFLTKLLKGKNVYIQFEGGKPTKDKEGRLFAYAYRSADGLFINAEIIRRGYGRVHKPFSFKHEKAFRQLEGIARNSKKGLWASIARVPTVPSAPAIPKPDLSNKDAYSVDRVIDGDTFVVAFPQTKTGIPKVTMRLIGVDAPQGVERYGKEASAFLTTLLKGKKVYTLWEGWKPTKNKEGRLFVYAYRAADGLFINAEIIRRGYGRVHKPFSFKHEKAFRQLEGIARNSKKGLWASTARR